MLFSTLATNLCDEGRTIWTTLQNVLSFLTVNLDFFSMTLPAMCVEVCNLMQMRDFWTFISFIHIIKDRKKIFTRIVILSLKLWSTIYIYCIRIFNIYHLAFSFQKSNLKGSILQDGAFSTTKLFLRLSSLPDYTQ